MKKTPQQPLACGASNGYRYAWEHRDEQAMSNPNPKTAHLAPPWPKGVSGNPLGRRKRPLSDRYSQLLEDKLPEELRKPLKLPVGALWGDAIALVAARTALKSSEVGVLQRKEIADRIEGKAAARFEVAGGGNGMGEFIVTYLNAIPAELDATKIIDVTPNDEKQLPAGEPEEGSE